MTARSLVLGPIWAPYRPSVIGRVIDMYVERGSLNRTDDGDEDEPSDDEARRWLDELREMLARAKRGPSESDRGERGGVG